MFIRVHVTKWSLRNVFDNGKLKVLKWEGLCVIYYQDLNGKTLWTTLAVISMEKSTFLNDLPIDPMANSQNSSNLLSLAKESGSSTIIQLPNLSLKLDRNNYCLWIENTLDILKAFSLYSFSATS
ncbi:hypothetical protein P3L10_026672 [Capsicum annuum]